MTPDPAAVLSATGFVESSEQGCLTASRSPFPHNIKVKTGSLTY